MKYLFPVTLIMLTALACKKKEEPPKAILFSANGTISDQLNSFRNLLGTALNTTPNVSGGRREINWDGVPDELDGKPLPNDFFNPKSGEGIAARQRGLVYTGNGTFMVSANKFAQINADASTEFAAFSGHKIFANTDASLWDIAFEVAGTSIAASVKGFGAVFADVDVANSTFIEFFSGTKSLGKYFVPVQKDGNKFSFLGVYFENKTITSVRIGHNGILKDGSKDVSQGGNSDLIVLDDFLYSEPVAK